MKTHELSADEFKLINIALNCLVRGARDLRQDVLASQAANLRDLFDDAHSGSLEIEEQEGY